MKNSANKDKKTEKKLKDKSAEKQKAKSKKDDAPVVENPKPTLPVSDSNSGYIPFGG